METKELIKEIEKTIIVTKEPRQVENGFPAPVEEDYDEEGDLKQTIISSSDERYTYPDSQYSYPSYLAEVIAKRMKQINGKSFQSNSIPKSYFSKTVQEFIVKNQGKTEAEYRKLILRCALVERLFSKISKLPWDARIQRERYYDKIKSITKSLGGSVVSSDFIMNNKNLFKVK